MASRIGMRNEPERQRFKTRQSSSSAAVFTAWAAASSRISNSTTCFCEKRTLIGFPSASTNGGRRFIPRQRSIPGATSGGTGLSVQLLTAPVSGHHVSHRNDKRLIGHCVRWQSPADIVRVFVAAGIPCNADIAERQRLGRQKLHAIGWESFIRLLTDPDLGVAVGEPDSPRWRAFIDIRGRCRQDPGWRIAIMNVRRCPKERTTSRGCYHRRNAYRRSHASPEV